MGLKKFKISLDGPVFFAGQTVSGKLILTLKKPTKIRGEFDRTDLIDS